MWANRQRRYGRISAVLATGLLLSGSLVISGEARADEAADAPASAPIPSSPAARRDAAKAAYTEAEGRFELGDWASALPLYQRAYLLHPGGAPRFKIAVCLDKLGRTKDATAAYEEFIKLTKAFEFKAQVAEAKERLAALKTQPSKISVSTDPPNVPSLKLTVDGEPQPALDFTLPPGKHTIVAKGEGWSGSRDVEVTHGESIPFTIRMVQDAPPPPPPPVVAAVVAPPPAPTVVVQAAPSACPGPCPKPPGVHSSTSAWLMIGLGVASGAAGGYYGLKALSTKKTYEDAPTTDKHDLMERQARVADLFIGGAVVLGIAGAAIILSTVDYPAPSARASEKRAGASFAVAPQLGPKGGGAEAVLRF